MHQDNRNLNIIIISATHLDKAEAIRGFQGHSEAFRGDHLLDLDEAMPIDSGRVGIV